MEGCGCEKGIGKSEDMKRIEKGVVNSNEEGIKKRGRKVSNKKYRFKNCDFFLIFLVG